ncbi:HAD family hydrolase [Streptomyces sp. JNUCC 63]
MAAYRLVATDLDGTLLRSDGTLSAFTLSVIAELRERGVETVFVTARHLSAVLALDVPYTAVREAVVCAGAAYCALPSGHVLESWLLTAEVARDIVEKVRATVPDIAFGWVVPDSTHDVTVEPHYFPDRTGPDWPVADTESIDQPLLKLFARAPHRTESAFVDSIAPLLVGRARIAHSTAGFVDLVAPGVSKSSALSSLCQARGFAADEVIAFGDTRADLDMLQWAGLGIAVDNAEPALLAVADMVIGHCNRDSVAAYLHKSHGLSVASAEVI